MDCEALAAELLASPYRAQITVTLQAMLEVGTAAHQADPPLHITNAAVVHHGDPNLPVKVGVVIPALESQALTLASSEDGGHYLLSSPTPESIHPGFSWYEQYHFHGAQDPQIPQEHVFHAPIHATYLQALIDLNGEPQSARTMGEGYPIYDTSPLQTEEDLGWELHDEEHGIGGYPFRELSAVDIGINHALLNIGSEGMLADVL
jgi:hypothetical protein